MTTTNSSKPATPNWRNLIDELTADNIEVLTKMERAGIANDTLVEDARIYAQGNFGTRIYFGHLPEPTGAVEMHTAVEVGDCEWVREFSGTCREVVSKDNIQVTITGNQYPDGNVERYLHIIHQDRNDPDKVGTLLLDAADVGRFATAVMAAAHEIDLSGEADKRYPAQTLYARLVKYKQRD